MKKNRLMKIVFFTLILLSCSVCLFAQDNQLKTGFYTVIEKDSCIDSVNCLKITSEDQEYCINKSPVITDDSFTSVKIVSDTTKEGIYNTVRIKLDTLAAKGFKETTARLVGKRLAFIINDKIITAPVLRDPIESGEIAVFCDDETINIIKKEFGIINDK